MSGYDKCCRVVAGGVELRVKVVPGASRDRIAGVLGDALKIKVAAPPEKGRANQAVIALLASTIGCAAGDLSVVQGAASPRKTIHIKGLTAGEVIAGLARAASR